MATVRKTARRAWEDIGDHGAIGDGGTDDTGAFIAALSRLQSAGGGTLFVPGPATFLTDQVLVGFGNIDIVGAGRGAAVIQLAPQTIDIDDWGGAILVRGTAGNILEHVTIRHLTVRGAKGQHTFGPSGVEFDVECINLKYCRGFLLYDLEMDEGHDSGIDLDDCSDGVVQACHGHDCGGYGIHVSLNSTRNRIIANLVESNGAEHLRGGIDQHFSASENAYGFNVALNNYRNYNIGGTGGQWIANHSGGTTTMPDAIDPDVAALAMPLSVALRGDDGTGTWRTLAQTLDVSGAVRASLGSNALPLQLLGTARYIPTGDMEWETASTGPIIRSPDGTRYRVVVSNAGALSAAAV